MGPSSRLKVTAALRNTHRIQKNKNSAAFHDQPHKEKLNFPTSSLRLVSDTWIQQQQHTHTHTKRAWTQKNQLRGWRRRNAEYDHVQKNKKLPPCVKARVDNGEGRLYLPGVLMEGGKKGAVWFHRRHAFMSSKDKKKKRERKEKPPHHDVSLHLSRLDQTLLLHVCVAAIRHETRQPADFFCGTSFCLSALRPRHFPAQTPLSSSSSSSSPPLLLLPSSAFR